MLKTKNKFNIEVSNEKIKTIFWTLLEIILFKESLGINPPVETKVIVRFKELNNLTSERFNITKITKLVNEYAIKIFKTRFFILFEEFKLPSPENVSSVILKLNFLLEKIKMRNKKKYKPPIHWEEERHKTNVGSKYLIFSKIEKPVPVKPDIDSKIEFKNVTW